MYRRPLDRLTEILPFVSYQLPSEFWALRDVNLSVERGEVLGIVGPNGSGKSTLLQIICGILEPTRGRVVASGRIAALLELGAGFNPEFSGRENVFLNGEILGISRRRWRHVFPQIEKFAEIGTFMNRPVKEYSSGMYVRLAFSTAIHVDPEILIVDEALAVGDAIFANRCIKKFEELKQRKVTVLFVSHDLGLVKRLSDRAALMVEGEWRQYGAPSEVVNRYVGMVLERQDAPRTGGEGFGGSYRHGDGASRILSVEMLPSKSVAPGEPVTIVVRAKAEKDLENPVVGYPDSQSAGYRCVWHEYADRASGSGMRACGRDFRGRVRIRLPVDAAGLYTDGCHAISGRLQPGLAGRRDFVLGSGCARCCGAREFSDARELAADRHMKRSHETHRNPSGVAGRTDWTAGCSSIIISAIRWRIACCSSRRARW